MTREALRATVLHVLGEIAPEADLAALSPGLAFREQLDLDSMDLLNFVVALHGALGVDIPEADYPKLATLDACVEYLEPRTSRASHA
ncbi:MAG TPA: phosphopantetheine-binding protein [Methylomirabilota bacterium]|nr:phosphopantetheine-binding protein [Methylomirabilota bacterium]